MNYDRCAQFQSRLAHDLYRETSDSFHEEITRERAAYFTDTYCSTGQHILDVGCGTGCALETFKARGYEGVGVDIGDDVNEINARGLRAEQMDMHDMTFPDHSFDAIWCRHTLEHSFMPFFLLVEFNRLLNHDGVLYIEVPAPGTAAHHESNQNHYSCLSGEMLGKLIERAGFRILEFKSMSFQVKEGIDIFMMFIARKQKDFY